MDVKVEKVDSKNQLVAHAGSVVEYVCYLMQLYGIKSIDVSNCICGEAIKTVVAVKPFDRVPTAVLTAGMVAKDYLAGIMLTASVIRVTLSESEDELAKLVEKWNTKPSDKIGETSGSESDGDGSK